MPQPPRLDYRNQDLRNRSFKNQDLTGADFSGADIRGCNFSGATLIGANFQRVRTGRSLKQRTVQLALAVGDANSKIYTVAAVFTVVFTVTFGFTFTAALAGALTAFASGATAERMAWSGLSALLAVFAIYPFRELKRKILYMPDIIFPGTVFEYADLTSASFAHASVQNADFRSATLDFVKWTNASFARCKLPKSFDDKIRALVTSLDGHDQDYRYANLKNLHLAGVILTGANLAEADLSGSKLNYANLEHANLRGIQASGTDFSNAVLTGACIQHWGINAATRFDDVRCDYIYLEPDNQERRPASGIFQPGDFEKLVNQFTDTLDFLFRNGIEPRAFDAALQNLLVKYEDAGLSLQAVVSVGDGDRLIKLNVANFTADRAAMHAQFTQDYAAMQKRVEVAQEKLQLQAVVDVGGGDRLIKLNVANFTADQTLMQARLTRDYAAMQKRLEVAQENIQALQQQLAYAEGQLIERDQFTHDYAAMQKQLEAAQEKIQALQEQLEAARATVRALQQKLARAEGLFVREQPLHDYAAMQKQLEVAQENIQVLQEKLAHVEGQLTVHQEQSVFLQRFIYHQTDRFSRPTFNAPNSHFTGDLMPDNDNSIQFGNVQGDVSGIASGDISGVAGKDITGAAGGDISGTLTLTLGQLEATKDPDALKLADLLKQLKTAIEGKDAGLDAKDKERALKHLDAIAKLGGDRKNPDLLERAGDALDALPTIVKRGNGLLEFSEKYLPTITAGIKTVLATWGIPL